MDIIDKVLYDTSYEPDKEEYNKRLLAYRELFSSPQAETVIRDLIAFCRFNDESISDSGVLNAHKQGLTDAIKHIKKMINSEIIDIGE